MSTPNRRLSWRTASLVFICLLLLPCLGGVAGVLVNNARQAGDLARWRRLPAPPAPAAALVAADLDSVYVRAEDGTLYGCAHRNGDDGPACWSPVDAPPPVDSDARLGEPEWQAPPPPGPARDSLVVTFDYADAAFEAHYALLEDGRVWVWEHSVQAYLALAQLCAFPLVGAALALALGGLLLGVAAWRRRAAPPK